LEFLDKYVNTRKAMNLFTRMRKQRAGRGRRKIATAEHEIRL
jgi:hypothetical protein